MRVSMYDSTLRDGAQGENMNFSVQDKIAITKALDEIGIDFIEAGNPFSNPKDKEFFEASKNLELSHAKIVAFGSTRRVGVDVKEDKSVNVMAEVPCEHVAIFGKSWDLHATKILNTTLEENLNMIYDTIKYLTEKGKYVFFDAEHFFDGYKNNPEYAIQTLKTAEKAGAKSIALCDTNGGCFPHEIEKIVKEVCKEISCEVGIHCHNDSGCAVANTVSAVIGGARSVQGTFIGIGERCGNTCLSTVIPNLQLKLGYEVIPETSMKKLTSYARYIAELSNITLSDGLSYVGKSAFAHKGGMHIDGVSKLSKSFEHIDPSEVGNERQFLLSEVSGRTAILSKIKTFLPDIEKGSPILADILEMLKIQEQKGFQYEAADASFELLVKRFLGQLDPFFHIEYFKVITEPEADRYSPACAMVKVKVGNTSKMAADEGNGPVNALDKAIRNALAEYYPDVLSHINLIDYKVRVVDTASATAAAVRVLIESTDGKDVWTTVGASTDIINASVKALVDSIEYKLQRVIASKD